MIIIFTIHTFIYINGKPGSGKDTQANILCEWYGQNSQRISTGDIYRSAKSGEGEFARFYNQIQPYVESVDNGHFLPDKLIVNIVKDYTTKRIREGIETFIFTGFPRTNCQLELVDSLINKRKNMAIFLYYEVSDETSISRAEHRRNIAIANGDMIRRDDMPEIVNERLRVFNELTQPMLDSLYGRGRLITINAEGDIEKINQETRLELMKNKYMCR